MSLRHGSTHGVRRRRHKGAARSPFGLGARTHIRPSGRLLRTLGGMCIMPTRSRRREIQGGVHPRHPVYGKGVKQCAGGLNLKKCGAQTMTISTKTYKTPNAFVSCGLSAPAALRTRLSTRTPSSISIIMTIPKGSLAIRDTSSSTFRFVAERRDRAEAFRALEPPVPLPPGRTGSRRHQRCRGEYQEWQKKRPATAWGHRYHAGTHSAGRGKVAQGTVG